MTMTGVGDEGGATDAPTMPTRPDTPRVWSAGEIAALVSGRLVRTSLPSGLDVTPPAALVAAAAGVLPNSAAQALQIVHPDDTPLLLEAIAAMAANPGEMVELDARFKIDGLWRRVDSRLLNLAHQPEAGYYLNAAIRGDPLDEVPDVPRSMSGGDHNSIDWMVCHLDNGANFLHGEGKVENIFRRSLAELMGRRLSEFLHWESAADSLALWVSLLGGGPGTTKSSRRCIVRPDGTELWCEITYLNRLVAGGGDVHGPDGGGDILVLICDITERRAEEAETRLLADEVPFGIARCEEDGIVTFHNARWTEMFADLGSIRRVHDVAHEDDREAIDLAVKSLIAGEADVRTEVRDRLGSRMLGIRLRRVPGDDGSPLRIVVSVDDITATIRWRNEARQDALTGLPNRSALEERLDADLAGDPGGTAVVFLDLDDFKAVNDRHGHEAGDTVLRAIANRLSAVVRPGDLVSRFGGDEFVLVLTQVAPVDLDAVIGRIRDGIESGGPIPLAGGLWDPAASIGAVIAEPGEGRAEVLNRADQSMYAAKRAIRAPTSGS